MEHPDTERLSAYLEHDLTGQELAEVARHVKECARCRAELIELEQLVSAFHALPELPAPAGFALRVMDRIEATERRGFWGFVRRWRLGAVIAPVAVAALTLLVLQNPESDKISMPAVSQAERAARDEAGADGFVPKELLEAPAEKALPATSAKRSITRGDAPASPSADAKLEQRAAEAPSDAGAAAALDAPAPVAAPATRNAPALEAAPAGKAGAPPEAPLEGEVALSKEKAAREVQNALPSKGDAAPLMRRETRAPQQLRAPVAEQKEARAQRNEAPKPGDAGLGGLDRSLADESSVGYGVGGSGSGSVGERSSGYGVGGSAGGSQGVIGYGAGGSAGRSRDADKTADTGFAPSPPARQAAAGPTASPEPAPRAGSPTPPESLKKAASQPTVTTASSSRAKTAPAPAGAPAAPAPASGAPATSAAAPPPAEEADDSLAARFDALEPAASSEADEESIDAQKSRKNASKDQALEKPDAVIVLVDKPDLVRQVQGIVRDLKGSSLAPEPLPGGRLRVRVTLPTAEYRNFLKALRRLGALGATPPPAPDTSPARIWIEINPAS